MQPHRLHYMLLPTRLDPDIRMIYEVGEIVDVILELILYCPPSSLIDLYVVHDTQLLYEWSQRIGKLNPHKLLFMKPIEPHRS